MTFFVIFSTGGKISGALCVISGIIIITPLLPIIESKFSSIQEKAKLEKASVAQNIADEDSSESSEQAANMFAESLLTSSKSSARPRSSTVH